MMENLQERCESRTFFGRSQASRLIREFETDNVSTNAPEELSSAWRNLIQEGAFFNRSHCQTLGSDASLR
jgi:hypothetical protein